MHDFKEHFPVLTNSGVRYFDYAATTPMPSVVMAEWTWYQSEVGVSPGKGVGRLSRKALTTYEESEATLRRFFGVRKEDSLIYGKNVTEMVNVISRAVEELVRPMEAIVVGPYEHHSNVLPWKYLAKRKGALFFEIPVGLDGSVDYRYLERIPAKIRILAYSSVANANGFRFDIDRASMYLPGDALVFEDASQAVAHEAVRRKDRVSGVFLSSHKMYGPKGIAGLVVDSDLMDEMTPILLGGGMVDFHGFLDKWKSGAMAFMAGTYDIGLLCAWARACRFVMEIGGYELIARQDIVIRDVVVSNLARMSGYRVLSDEQSASLVSFVHRRMHAHDVASFLGERDLVVRSGNLCATSAIRRLGVHALTRVSFGLGVAEDDVSALLEALLKLNEM